MSALRTIVEASRYVDGKPAAGLLVTLSCGHGVWQGGDKRNPSAVLGLERECLTWPCCKFVAYMGSAA